MKKLPRVILSPGEPAGVGPDVLIQCVQQEWPAELVTIGDPKLFYDRAKLLGLPLTIVPYDLEDLKNPPQAHLPRTLKVVPVSLAEACEPGKLNPANAAYVIECLKIATQHCLTYGATLATGPIQKSLIHQAGIPFTGHTEFLAEQCGAPKSLMLFVAPTMKVALATTHIPLSQVSSAITAPLLTTTIQLLHAELIKHFKIPHPTILVAGLNPHAGESGLLGVEEIKVITPVIQALQHENINVQGPLPADTIFTEPYFKKCDAILAMYHDQALTVVKYLGFGKAVNVTLGLPFIRTSVDHGTALALAGTLQADPSSLNAAIQLAMDLVNKNEK